MIERTKTIFHILSAAVVLLLVSAYRQISYLYFPHDDLRPYLVYAVYLVLLLLWQNTVQRTILQKSMRMFLSMQNVVAILYLTVRFIQDAFLLSNIKLLRFTGYFINIPVALLPLLGLYASFGLGKGNDYRMNKKWWLLLIPAVMLIGAALSSDYHQFFYAVNPLEPQPNISFHPNIGVYLIYAWGIGLILMQVTVLCHRSLPQKSSGILQKLYPFYEPLFLIVFSIPYIINSYYTPQFELVEYSSGLIFILVLSWNLYILLGLIPINTEYELVFSKSTIGMRITDENGETIAVSENSMDLDPALLDELRRQKHLKLDTKLLNLYQSDEEYVIWQNDLSEIYNAVDKITKTNEELMQEKELAEKEMQIRAQEANIQVLNDIYDELTEQVSDQLILLQELLKNQPTSGSDWNRICLIGTFIKRYSNLLLIYWENGWIPDQDLRISLNDMIHVMEQNNIPASFDFSTDKKLDALLTLSILKGLEQILEITDFSECFLSIHIDDEVFFEITNCNAVDLPETIVVNDYYQLEKSHSDRTLCFQLNRKEEDA